MSLNRVTLIGHVGLIKINTLNGQNGPRKCAMFSFATTEKYKDRNGNPVENTEWHNIVSWNHAELCDRYVRKGTQLYVEGKLRTRTWEDQQGNKKYTTEILAEKIDLLGKKENTQNNQQQPQQAPVQQAYSQQPQYQNHYGSTHIPPAGEPEDDDMPF